MDALLHRQAIPNRVQHRSQGGVRLIPAGPGRPGPHDPVTPNGADLPYSQKLLFGVFRQWRMLTARAITRSEVTKAAIACMPIITLARVDSGMVSVGLKAVEFVTETYR